MRSHPYTAPPSLPSVFDEVADELGAKLPNQGRSRRDSTQSDTEIELGGLDPDTSRLIPVRSKRHHVRVQGKLVVVRSVSAANLRATRSPAIDSPPIDRAMLANMSSRYEFAVGSSAAPRRPRDGGRRSIDGSASRADSETETEEEVRETVKRDRQLRGYGIGGAGNIRRPTEVLQFSSRREGSGMTLFSSVLPSSPTSPTSPNSEKRRWNIRGMLGLTSDRKGKPGIAS